jgi:hypothetical protein
MENQEQSGQIQQWESNFFELFAILKYPQFSRVVIKYVDDRNKTILELRAEVSLKKDWISYTLSNFFQ